MNLMVIQSGETRARCEDCFENYCNLKVAAFFHSSVMLL